MSHDVTTLLTYCCILFYYSEGETFVPKVSSSGQNVDGTEKWAYVDTRPGAHIFYWLYHTYHPDGVENRPWILWLQVLKVQQHNNYYQSLLIMGQTLIGLAVVRSISLLQE